MTKVKVICDSACDLSEQLYKKYNIDMVPLNIIVNNKQYKDILDIGTAELFNMVEKDKILPKTAAISIEDYRYIFKKYVDEGYSVIHINITSCLTSCHQNAIIAANEVGNVYVVDSKTLSSAAGYMAIVASEMASQDKSVDQIYERMLKMAGNIEVSFLIDTLAYLHKGGRCSTITALGANFLKLKPCIEVENGNLKVGKKYRGNYKKCLCNYIADKLKDNDDIEKSRIILTHALAPSEMVNAVRSEIKKFMPNVQIIENITGCTIASHCGPSTLGVGVILE